MYIKYPHALRKNIKMLSLGTACLCASFVLGLISIEHVTPAQLIEAGGLPATGDIDGNGTLDSNDVTLILEIVQGYREATPSQLKADPNADGVLTLDDALRILSRISLR